MFSKSCVCAKKAIAKVALCANIPQMKLKRKDFQVLDSWYNSPLRKMVCILFGARQVGKSTLASEFAGLTGRKCINVNFWKDPRDAYKKIFRDNASAKSVLENLEISLNTKIDEDKSFLVLDEIQECPSVYTLCKSLKEDTNIPVIATGSYLKLFLAREQGHSELRIPVGCTYEKLITPLSFSEYLLNRNTFLAEKFAKLSTDKIVDKVIHEELLGAYREYIFVGGMPEAVSVFLDLKEDSMQKAIHATREIHKTILAGYQNDFLTFKTKQFTSRNLADKLNYTFNTIAKELQKNKEVNTPVRKFKLSSLGKNTTYSRVSNVFDYLVLCGLIIRSNITTKTKEPLFSEGDNKNAFKCFYFDVGMLNTKLNISYKSIIDDEYNSFKGYIAENFVAQEMYHCLKEELLSWTSKNYEIEFLYWKDNELFPIEVKSSKRSLSSPSLRYYIQTYKPKRAYKIAPRNFGENKGFVSQPIYFIEKIL